MKKTVQYMYVGTNGTIVSPVHLEDIYYIRKFLLEADTGKILVNGDRREKRVLCSEDDVNNWKEVTGQL